MHGAVFVVAGACILVYIALQRGVLGRNVLPCVTVRCRVLKSIAVRCSVTV